MYSRKGALREPVLTEYSKRSVQSGTIWRRGLMRKNNVRPNTRPEVSYWVSSIPKVTAMVNMLNDRP